MRRMHSAAAALGKRAGYTGPRKLLSGSRERRAATATRYGVALKYCRGPTPTSLGYRVVLGLSGDADPASRSATSPATEESPTTVILLRHIVR